MHARILIDGVRSTQSWLNDRAFQYGDGLFETIAIIDGTACLWHEHVARLLEGCDRLRLPAPDVAALHRECRDLATGVARGILKLYWTAGASQRGYGRPQTIRPRRILCLFDWPDRDPCNTWTLRLCQHRLSANPALAGIKHLNRLDQVLARDEWQDDSVNEGVMLGQDGMPVSGTMSNLFAQVGPHLWTPPVVSSGIAGVVRRIMLEPTTGDPGVARERPIQLAELLQADALYATNSLIGVMRVARFETKVYDLTIAEHAAVVRARKRCHERAVAS